MWSSWSVCVFVGWCLILVQLQGQSESRDISGKYDGPRDVGLLSGHGLRDIFLSDQEAKSVLSRDRRDADEDEDDESEEPEEPVTGRRNGRGPGRTSSSDSDEDDEDEPETGRARLRQQRRQNRRSRRERRERRKEARKERRERRREGSRPSRRNDIRCKLPAAPSFGSVRINPLTSRVSDQGASVGSVLEFQCAPAYQLVGSENLRCMADGSWNTTIPVCKGLEGRV